ncbi:MAG: DUF4349 domain-containing protein [Candidatus Promineofilum sp.]|uniref:DUF4349 domain-containing protein n=1 Tax=Promineifilum sp. TaxID=2664178 RepID=UPI002411F04E|nr:DUF4349 domain-containing protein [Promineifilum sp.]
MQTNRTSIVVVFSVIIALILTACAAAQQNVAVMDNAGMSAPASEAPVADDAFYAEGEASAAPLPAAQTARKIIARAEMDLAVSDTQTAVDTIEAKLAEVNGYVSDANLYMSAYGSSELLRGSMTVRVPAEELEPFMDAMHDLAVDVRSESVTREDVTDQYSDTEAQLRNLRAAEEELLALLAEVRERPDATSEDILAVYNNITQIRAQIEQLQGRKNMLDNLVGLSILTLELTPDALTQPVLDNAWRPMVVARDAVRALLNSLKGLGSAAIWFVLYALPLLLLAAVPIILLIWLLRKALQWLDRRTKTRRGKARNHSEEEAIGHDQSP